MFYNEILGLARLSVDTYKQTFSIIKVFQMYFSYFIDL